MTVRVTATGPGTRAWRPRRRPTVVTVQLVPGQLLGELGAESPYNIDTLPLSHDFLQLELSLGWAERITRTRWQL